MIQVVVNYQQYLESLKENIDKSPYKTSFFIEQLRMSKQTFYRKIRDKTFTVNEVDKITRLLFPEESLKQMLVDSEIDVKEGRLIPHADAMRILRKQYAS